MINCNECVECDSIYHIDCAIHVSDIFNNPKVTEQIEGLCGDCICSLKNEFKQQGINNLDLLFYDSFHGLHDEEETEDEETDDEETEDEETEENNQIILVRSSRKRRYQSVDLKSNKRRKITLN